MDEEKIRAAHVFFSHVRLLKAQVDEIRALIREKEAELETIKAAYSAIVEKARADASHDPTLWAVVQAVLNEEP